MSPSLPTLRVRDLGVLEYERALAHQRAVVEARTRGDGVDTLLVVEHPAVITLGRRRGADAHIITPGATPVVRVERGGDVTWHGPGQLVGYPILALGDGERDVHRFLRGLEDALIGLMSELGLDALRVPGATGVWARRPGTHDDPQKLVSLGIAITHWVTFHGFALNVDPDLAEFGRIQPCGFAPERMGSLASLGARLPSRDELIARVAFHLARALGRALDRDSTIG